VVLCTGQKPRLAPEDGFAADLRSAAWVGGAVDAAELNAARAIRQGYEAAVRL